MNNYIKIAIKHAHDTIEEIDHNNKWIESRDGMEA